jgi:hypothetical protein
LPLTPAVSIVVSAPEPVKQADIVDVGAASARVADGPVVPVQAPAPAPAIKSPLTAEEFIAVKARRFAIQNTLEENGFTPSDGMSNFEKMRKLAALMFPGVPNFNVLNMSQWEKYLSTLEAKIRNEGPKQTIQYIEESIQ